MPDPLAEAGAGHAELLELADDRVRPVDEVGGVVLEALAVTEAGVVDEQAFHATGSQPLGQPQHSRRRALTTPRLPPPSRDRRPTPWRSPGRVSQFCRMARILHLVAANHRRGAETFAVELAEHHRSAGHEVRVMAVADAGVDESLAGRGRGVRAGPIRRGIARIVAAARWSDVVVSFGSSSLLDRFGRGTADAPPVRLPPHRRPGGVGEGPLSDLRVGVPARSAARVVALYPGAAESLMRLYRVDERTDSRHPARRSGGSLRTRPTPTSGQQPGPSSVSTRTARGSPTSGRSVREKDPLLAVEALAFADAGRRARHRRRRTAHRRGGGRPLVRSATGSACSGWWATWTPVYAAADALVLPSRTEGIPGAAVEAGLCGLPVVSFDVGGVASVVLDGVTGILLTDRDQAELAASLSEVLRNRSALGQEARRHCLENFSMRAVGAPGSI